MSIGVLEFCATESACPWERLKNMIAFLVNLPSYHRFSLARNSNCRGRFGTCRLLDLLTITSGFGSVSARPTDQYHSEADHNSRREPHISRIAREIFGGREYSFRRTEQISAVSPRIPKRHSELRSRRTFLSVTGALRSVAWIILTENAPLYSRGDCVNRPSDPKAVGHEGMGTRLQFQFPGLTLDARS